MQCRNVRIIIIIRWPKRGIKNENSRTTTGDKAETARSLIFRDHSATFGSVDSFKHLHDFLHLWPFHRIRIPTSLHYVR